MKCIYFREEFQETNKLGSLGRNGWADNNGIAAVFNPIRENFPESSWSGITEITPITSKGKEQRCKITLPPDADLLRKLSDFLRSVADEIDSTR